VITLITGLPGHGKTLNALYEIHTEFAHKRPIYYKSKAVVDETGSGIPGLTLAGWTPFDNTHAWWDLPDGAVIVIDECQYDLPRRSPGKEPDWIAPFAEHRKKGFDVFLITQDCRNIDYFVRRLAGRHLHFWRPMGMSRTTRWEFPCAVENPLDRLEQKKASSCKLVKFPQQFFNVYQSANLHTVKRSIPAKFYVLPIALCVVMGLAFAAYRMLSKSSPRASPAVSAPVPSSSGVNFVKPGAAALPAKADAEVKPAAGRVSGYLRRQDGTGMAMIELYDLAISVKVPLSVCIATDPLTCRYDGTDYRYTPKPHQAEPATPAKSISLF
jgi:zona occludens toxin